MAARVCVLGGGAAGFFSAVACAEAAGAAARGGVVILERSAEVLRKVRISGGGRCNVTHRPGKEPAEHYPRGAELVARLAARHGAPETAAWFEARGVPLKTEPDGRVFPASDSSDCIVRCLAGAAERLGVEVRTEAKVAAASRVEGPGGPCFRLELEGGGGGGGELLCERLIVCCGSAQRRSIKRLLEGLGAPLVPTVPSLFSLLLAEDSGMAGLEGVSAPDAAVELVLDDHGAAGAAGPAQRGPLLFTHDGVSGPAILRLSAWSAYELSRCGYNATLRLRWAPWVEDEEAAAAAIRAVPTGIPGERPPIRKMMLGEKSPWPGRVPARLWRRLLERSEPAAADLLALLAARHPRREYPLLQQQWQRFEDPEASLALARAVWGQLQGQELRVRGRRENKQEFVTAGGVDWRGGIDLDRMESEASPGVHFAGEVLDVDGITGGFNFQACWSTGFVAGRAAAEVFSQPPPP